MSKPSINSAKNLEARSDTTNAASDVRGVLSDTLHSQEHKKAYLIALLAEKEPNVAIKLAIEFIGKGFPNDIVLSPQVQEAAKACLERKLLKTNAHATLDKGFTLEIFVQTFAIDRLELGLILGRVTFHLLKNAGIPNVIEINKVLPFPESVRRDSRLRATAKKVVAILRKHPSDIARSDAAKIAEIFHLAIKD